MISFLTSSLGGSVKHEGKRIPAPLINTEGAADKIKEYWKENADVLIISASPDAYERSDSIRDCLKEAFPMSGLSVGTFDLCDSRNEHIAQCLCEYDVVILTGGHVPTQNAFLHEIGAEELLKNFEGMLIAWSAGSMNAAETVYAHPEEDGEAADPSYQRFLPGLGITGTMILPHFQNLRLDMVDGLRALEDIAFPDSRGREFLGLNDGSFLLNENGSETIFGEAYSIGNGKMNLICPSGRSLRRRAITVEEAERLLEEGVAMNPGPWGEHSRNVARCAERIAEKCNGMDPQKAYIYGLLHDIGRRFGVTHLAHVYDGYQFMMDQGYDDVARICLTHSFNLMNMKDYIGRFDISEAQQHELSSLLEKVTPDEYDMLIQLCDSIGAADGVVPMEERMRDIRKRYGYYPQEKWIRNLELRIYFERRIGMDIYDVCRGH